MALDYSYNLNTVKEVQVSDDFLSLDREEAWCQNEESYEDCTTKNYLETLQEECGCLPLTIGMKNEVYFLIFAIFKSI